MNDGPNPHEVLELLDWKSKVFEMYADVRHAGDAGAAWERWRAARDDLFRAHPQSPIPASQRGAFGALPYFGYDPAFRVAAEVEEADASSIEIAGSAGASFRFVRIGRASFDLDGRRLAFGLFWLEAYAGGLFVPFRDATGGTETYGGGRYLLDTAKGADLGTDGDRLILDFNFAYNPSCAYDPRWPCPLTPPENRLSVPIKAGERLLPTAVPAP